MSELQVGIRVRVIGPTIHGDTFPVGKITEVAAIMQYQDNKYYPVCHIGGWGYVWFPRESLQPWAHAPASRPDDEIRRIGKQRRTPAAADDYE